MTEKKTPKKDLTRAEWKAKYGSDTWYYTHNLDKVDITTGKTIRKLIEDASKEYNINPSTIASTLFSEGLDTYDKFDEKGNPYSKESYGKYPVSGFMSLGLDTIGNRKQELFRKGLISKEEYNKNVEEVEITNEKGRNIKSGNFANLGIGIKYVGAFLRMEGDNMDAYIEKNNIDVTPMQRAFFKNVAYNAGAGNAQDMITSHSNKGYLKQGDSYLDKRPDKYWDGVYEHAQKRTSAAMGLSEQGDFSEAPGATNPYVKQTAQPRESVTSVSSLETKGLSSVEVKALEEKARAKQTSVSGVKPKGLAAGNTEVLSAGKLIKKPTAKPRSKITAMNPITPEELKIKESFIKNLQLGLGRAESNNDYSAKNPTSTATGKYQFTKYWLKDAGSKSIQAFAKKNGLDIPQTMKEFTSDSILQDAYFRSYAGDTLYPLAKKAINGENPANLGLEQAGALFHFKPLVDDEIGNTGAIKQIKTGKFDKPTVAGKNGAKHTNSGSLEHIKTVTETIIKGGGKLTSKNTLSVANMTAEEKDKIGQEYMTSRKKIMDSEGLNDQEKNQKIRELQIKYNEAGTLSAVTDHIEKLNTQKKKDYATETKKSLYDEGGKFYEAIDNSYKKDIRSGKSGKESFEGMVKYWTGQHKEGVKDALPMIQALNRYQASKGILGFDMNGEIDRKKYNYMDQIGDGMQDAFRYMDKILWMGADRLGPDGKPAIQSASDERRRESAAKRQLVKEGNKKPTLSQIRAKAQRDAYTELSSIKNPKVEEELISKQDLIPTIDIENLPPVKEDEITPISNEKETSTEDAAEAGETEDTPEEAAAKAADGKINDADTFFKTEKGLLAADVKGMKDKPSYDKKDYKQELPMDAVAGLALGLIGNNEAKNANIPLRSEDVGQTIKMYIAELAKRSKDGLPPEVEAAMKNQLAEAYQGGLRSIVNASGGNRATVLGNLGQLEVAKNKGVVSAQIADYEAKERAFEQYGRAIEYADKTKLNRDIANTTLRQQQGIISTIRRKGISSCRICETHRGTSLSKREWPR